MISCGSNKIKHYNLLPTYTGQADQLIALGIKPDYYPYQLNQNAPSEYLTNPSKFMFGQDEAFAQKFSDKLKSLIPSSQGTSWWNQEALDDGEEGSDPTYWQQMEGDVLLYEQYLLDDDEKVIERSTAPRHIKESAIQTNFRASRDPFTRISKGIVVGWKLPESEIEQIINHPTQEFTVAITFVGSQAVTGILRNAFPSADAVTSVVTSEDAKLIKILKQESTKLAPNGEGSWFYNDYYFVDWYHKMFISNYEFRHSDFAKWVLDSSQDSPFSTEGDRLSNPDLDNSFRWLFSASTYTQEEVQHGMPYVVPGKEYSSQNPVLVNPHHPVYEQQAGEIGRAPMFEGAMRDNMLYLFDVSWQISNLANYGTPLGKSFYDSLPRITSFDDREGIQSQAEASEIALFVQNHLSNKQFKAMQQAFNNANKISLDIHARLKSMKKYFNTLGVVNDNSPELSKVFGLLTIAPGKGESTIQSISKYGFLYKELGFKQPVPKNIDSLASGAKSYLDSWKQGINPNLVSKEDGRTVIQSADALINKAVGHESMFNMDDNGWYWILTKDSDKDIHVLDLEKTKQFNNKIDLGVVAARDSDFNALISKNKDYAQALTSMFTPVQTINRDQSIDWLQDNQVDYDLWNEGLKTPFAFHMLLDKVVSQVEKYAHKELNVTINNSSQERISALNWGEYFKTYF